MAEKADPASTTPTEPGEVEPRRRRRATDPLPETFATLGLTPTDERVYRQVLGTRAPTAQAAARLLHLPVGQVRQSLGRLIETGLVRETSADVPEYVSGQGVRPSGLREPRYLPQPPSVTLASLLQRQAAALVRAGATVEHLSQLYAFGDEEQVDDRGLVTVVHGSEEVTRVVSGVLGATQGELLHLDRQPFVRGAGRASLQRAMVGLLARGVRVRTIYAGDAFRLPGYASYMAEAGRLGERARLLAHLPMRFVVSDRGAAVLPLVADGPWVGSALVVRGHSLVEDLVNVFDDLWERATDLDAGTGEAAAASRDVDEQESALLRMLAADMTERAIARHLGMSTRTVGRRIAVVQRSLGARTRFGLGAESARRGLV